MHLRSEHFAIDDLQLKDKENIRALAESRPWIKGLLRFKDSLPDADKFNVFDYFETQVFTELVQQKVLEDNKTCLEFLWVKNELPK